MNKGTASNLALLTVGTILIGQIVANGWLTDFHNFINKKLDASTIQTVRGKGINLKFLAGVMGLTLMLQFLVEVQPEIGGTLSGLVLLSYLLLQGPKVLNTVTANIK